MRKLLILFCFLPLLISQAKAQSSPGWSYGTVPTAGQWNAAFAAKADYAGAPACITTGCTLTGPLITTPSIAAAAGFSIPPGVAPTSPINGNIWTTNIGMYVRIAGNTIGPLIGTAQIPSATDISPGLAQCDTTTTSCGTGGVIHVVGAVASSVGVGTTTITSGTANGLFYDNAGVLGNLATANNGVAVTDGSGNPSISTTLPSGLAATNMTLTTPTLGVAGGTSLALGGATIGTNALAVTGTVLFNTPLSLASGGTAANLTASNGGIVYSGASAFAVLAGTSTPSLCLLSGANSAPSWGACTGAAAVASVGNASADTTLTIAGTGSGPYTGTVTLKINLGNANSWTAVQTFEASGIDLLGSSTGYTTFTSANSGASNYTLTFPAITDTVVALTAIQTLTNKTLSGPTLSGTVAGTPTWGSAQTFPSATIVGTASGADFLQINGASSGSGNGPSLQFAYGGTPYDYIGFASAVLGGSFNGALTIASGAGIWLRATNPTTQSCTGLQTNLNGQLSCTSSTKRYKNSIKPLSPAEALNTVMSLEPVSYNFNTDAPVNDAGEASVGLIAEQTYDVDHRLVGLDGDGIPSGLRDDRLIGELVGAIHALKAEVEILRRRK